MLAQGKLHREIGEKLGMARESVTRRIRRNNLLREVQAVSYTHLDVYKRQPYFRMRHQVFLHGGRRLGSRRN